MLPPLHLGLARTDITPELDGVGMLGWGMPGNLVRGVKTRLHARALVVEQGPAVLALVSLEICYITTLLRQGILRRLEEAHPAIPIDDVALLVTATHTHSAPGGYSHGRFDNASVRGLQPEVLETLIAGTVAALAQAWARRVPGALKLVAGEIPPELPVAFNRSLRAHHRNPEVGRRFCSDERHLAVEREMTLLRAEAADGRPLGLASWFGVHGTSVHSDNTLISADNKGYAATFCEAALAAEHPDFVALFLQGATGDVTPNHRRWPGKALPGGSAADDHQSAEQNGRIQADRALSLWEEAADVAPLTGPLRVGIEHRDMGDVQVDPDLVGGQEGIRTVSGAVGVRMLRGTWEGPGTPRPIGVALQLATRAWQLWVRLTPFLRSAEELRWHRVHGAKAPILAVGVGTVLGRGWTVRLIPPRFDHIMDHLAQQQRSIGTEPWLPQIVPLHLVTLGELGILGIPAEPTTQAGRRLQVDAARVLGVKRALLTGYSDDYSGYLATPEEYDHQGYEGAFTQFGRWTLPAWQTRIRRLGEQMRGSVTRVGEPLALPTDLEARQGQARRW